MGQRASRSGGGCLRAKPNGKWISFFYLKISNIVEEGGDKRRSKGRGSASQGGRSSLYTPSPRSPAPWRPRMLMKGEQ